MAVAAAGLAAPRVRHRLGLSPKLVTTLAWLGPLAASLAFPPTRGRHLWVYYLQQMAYFTGYELPGDDIDRLRARMRVRYPIALDRLLGVGEIPSIRLQRAFHTPGRIGPPDMVLSVLHWAWYFVPHGAVIAVACRRPDRLPRAAATVGLTFDLGLVVYRLIPTAPPWWAAENGHLPPVERIVVQTSRQTFGPAWEPVYGGLARNPFAAMPSLHMASSWAAAHALGELGPAYRAAGFAYSAGLALALVYLGEHYVVDLLAGVALAEAARAVVGSQAVAAVAGPDLRPES